MSGVVIGAAIGLMLGVVAFAALRALAGRVDLAETRKVLQVTAWIDLIAFPAAGTVVGSLMSGE